jgi:multidrug efflux pump subunit AcrB
VPRFTRRQKNEKTENSLQKFSLFFFDNVKLSLLLWAMILIGGVLAYTAFIKREGFPPIQIPIVIIDGTYVGADAAEVDAKLAKPIYDVLTDVDGVASVRTTAASTFFSAVVFFDDEVNPHVGSTIVQNEIVERLRLPETVNLNYRVVEPAKFLNQYDILLSVYNTDQLPLVDLSDIAGNVAEQLAAVDGVARSETQDQIAELTDPVSGRTIREQVSFGSVGVRDSDDRLEFHQSVTVGLVKDDGLDVIDFSRLVASELERVSGLPDGTEVVVSADFADSIQTQIDSLQMNLIGGLIAVAIVSFLLITWRASVITALFIVSVVMLIVFLLWVMGFTLNTITLFGLVLALGLFVDDATIVVEAIDAGRRKKRSPRQVVSAAIRKVAAASFAGTMTTVFVFLPLVFVGGVLGEFIRLLPITVMVALLSSLILSLSLIPFLSRYVLLRDKRHMQVMVVARAEAWASSKLAAVISWLQSSSKRRRGLFVGYGAVILSVFLVASAGFFASRLAFNIFPPSADADRVGIQISFAPETTISDAESISDRTNQVIGDEIGQYVVRVNYGTFSTPSTRGVDIQLDLVPFTDREPTARQLIDRLDSSLGQVIGDDVAAYRVLQFDAGPPSEEFPFRVQIYSEDVAASLQLAESMQQRLQSEPVVKPNGETVAVRSVRIDNVATVARLDGERFVEVQAAFEDDEVSALVVAAQEELETQFDDAYLTQFDGNVRVAYDFGQESDNAESFQSVILIFPIALALMYVLLALQFRSFMQPLLIFLAIPFSLFGVFFGLYVVGIPMSFFVMVGLIGLIGIAVNNSIMLTDYANQEQRAGADAVSAIAEAVRQRFRPLLTTTLTTIVALLPLALTDPFWKSLSLTIIFGLASSTLLIIIAFPYYYLVVEWVRSRSRQIVGKKSREKRV